MTDEEAKKVLKAWMPELELMAKYNNGSLDYQRYSAVCVAIERLTEKRAEKGAEK